MHRRKFMAVIAGMLAWTRSAPAEAPMPFVPWQIVEWGNDSLGFLWVRISGECRPADLPHAPKRFSREWVRYEYVAETGTIRYELIDHQTQKSEPVR